MASQDHPQLKPILSAGFGRFASNNAFGQARFGPNAGDKALELLATSIAKAREAGFEILAEDMNPQDIEDSLRRFERRLMEREWVAVNFGYGVRGVKENTVLFERLLGVLRLRRPGVRVMFSNGPDEVVEAVRRNFPESFGEGRG
ncbi:hypothetical protein LTR86_010662 [Recurvomyces mirabilis]|nr:hypothetical protein LTR86_010662 [Recurvomyces mirabilis]